MIEKKSMYNYWLVTFAQFLVDKLYKFLYVRIQEKKTDRTLELFKRDGSSRATVNMTILKSEYEAKLTLTVTSRSDCDAVGVLKTGFANRLSHH